MILKRRKINASHRLRKGRVSLPGHAYLITFATQGRRRLFDDSKRAMSFSQACMDDRLWHEASVLAWVLMPDHWHGLVRLGALETLSQLVQRLKANTARAVALGDESLQGRVWQAGFHDCGILGEKTLWAAADYLLANPLRAGLVESADEWPWRYAAWSASDPS